MQYVAHLFVGEVLDGLILLTKRGDSIHSCGKLKGLDEVIDIVMHAAFSVGPLYLIAKLNHVKALGLFKHHK